MSTGLTWVTITDKSSDSPDFQGSPVSFSDYSEAFAYAKWYIVQIGVTSELCRIYIYTSGPNQNGVFVYEGGAGVFYPIN